MKQGLRAFGERGVEAVYDEMKQLHKMDTIKPCKDLTHNDKRGALTCLMYLKEKRCGRIKGRGCADGRKQREHTDKHKATSPFVAIESVLLTSTIDAHEEWRSEVR